MKKLLLIILTLFSSIFSIELSINGEVSGLLDNQESKYGPVASQTLFGNQIALGGGLKIDSLHSISGGVFFTQEFGADYLSNLTPLIHYRYRSSKREILFGSFIRDNKIEYSEFIISTPYNFKNPVAEGFLYRRSKGKFSYTILADWIGRETSEKHEQFLIGCTGGGRTDHFASSWEFIYNHKAARVEKLDPIFDDGALRGNIGFRQDSLAFLHTIKADLSGLFSFSRNRSNSMTYTNPVGAEVNLSAKINRFGLSITHYHLLYKDGSDNHNIPTGDILYTTDMFDKVDLSVTPFKSDKVFFDVVLSFIFVDGGLDSRQTVNLNVPISLSRESFKKKDK